MSENRDLPGAEPRAGVGDLPALFTRLAREAVVLIEERIGLAGEEWRIFVARMRGIAAGFVLGVAALLIGATLGVAGVLLWLATWLAPAWVLFLVAGAAALAVGIILILVLARAVRGTEAFPYTRAALAEDREWLASKQ